MTPKIGVAVSAHVPADSPWSLFEALDAPIAVTDSDGTVAFANGALLDLMGSARSTLVGSRAFTLLEHGPHRELERLHAVAMATGESRCATTRLPAGASYRLARVTLRRCMQPNGMFVVWSFSTPMDAASTVNARAAEALAQSESRLELALWGTQVGFWDVDAVADEMRWRNEWCASIDVDPCEGRGHTMRWNAQVHPDDLKSTMTYEALVEGRTDVYEAEYRLRTHQGGWRWVLCRGRATARDGQGRALRVAGVTIDIDARKRAELALRESDMRLKAAVWGTDIGLWESNPDGDYAWFDDWPQRYDIDECRGPDQDKRYRARIHPDDIDRYREAADAAIIGVPDHYVAEYRVLTRGGTWRWLHERGNVTARDANGKAQHFIGVCLCVDEQKKLEAALRAAENRFELAVGAARLPVWEYDVESDAFTGNDYWDHAVGRDQADAGARNRKETWLSGIHPEDIAQVERVYAGEASKAGGLFQVEYRIQLPDGGYRWLLDRGRVVERTPGGQPRKVVGISVDIDSQKRLQAALQEGEARLETAVGGSDIGLWDWAVGSDALRWLSDWPLRKGIKETYHPTTYLELLGNTHPEDRQRLDADAGLVISGGQDTIERDYRFMSLQGEWHWIQVRAKVVERDRSGRAQRIVGACIDVDARRRTEVVLRTQAAILETMREGVVLFDHAGRIELTNPAFERLFHHTSAELMGLSIADLVRTGHASKVSLFGADRLLDRLRYRSDSCDVVFRRKDGSEFIGEVVTAPIALASGERRLAVVWDISERKRLEQEILDIANSERRRFGHELHDGLCQELAGVALMIRSIATNLNRAAPPATRQLEEIVGLVNNAIESARSMAHGLSPVALDGGGLETALRALVRRARSTYRISVRLRLKVSAHLKMSEATASHLYRITQEAINNAVKHGGARAVTVTLQSDDYNVRLSVSDDGIGLPMDAGSGAGMGLKIMDYRARLMGGVIDVAARRGGGTRVQCTCPTPAYRPQNNALAP